MCCCAFCGGKGAEAQAYLAGMRDGVSAATNDIGIITLPDGRHLAVAVFLSDSKAPAEARDAAIAKVARAGWDRFSTP